MKVFGALALILLSLIVSSRKLTAKQTAPVKKGNELWIKEGLPDGALARFGSTERNPNVIGVHSLRFSPDGKLLAVKDLRQNIRVLNLENRELVAVLRTESSKDFSFTPDSEFIALGARKVTRIWSIADKKEVRALDHSGYLVASSLGPKQLTIAGRGVVNQYPWPLPSKPALSRTGLTQGSILPVGISNDGRFVAFHNGNKFEVRDTSTDESLVPEKMPVVRKAIFAPNSKLMAAFNPQNQKLMLYDLRDPKKYQYKIFDKRRINTAAFSNDSRFLYTCSIGNEIVVWDLVTMQVAKRITGHSGKITALAARPGQMLGVASGSNGSHDRSVIFWSLRDELFPPVEDLSEFDLDLAWYDAGSDKVLTSLAATNLLYQALKDDSGLFDKLADKLRLTPIGDGNQQVSNLIANLDNPKYVERENATLRLRSMVDQIRPQLERYLSIGSQEAKWRINRILQTNKFEPGIASIEGRRKIRVIHALELCGGEDAKNLLNRITKASHLTYIVDQANSALSRLSASD